jgi:hypothetical protein
MVIYMSSTYTTVTVSTSTGATWSDKYHTSTKDPLRGACALQARIASRLGLTRPADAKITATSHNGLGCTMVTPTGETVTVVPA